MPSNSEDCIVATAMLYQVSDVKAALKEFKRILKPGGIIFTTFTHERGAHRVKRFTHEESLRLMNIHFTVKEAYKLDIGSVIIAVLPDG